MSFIFVMLIVPVVASLVMAMTLRRRGAPWGAVITMALMLPGITLIAFPPLLFRVTGVLLAAPGFALLLRNFWIGVRGADRPPSIAPETSVEKLLRQTELDDLEQTRVRNRRHAIALSLINLVVGVVIDQRWMVVASVVMAGFAWIATRPRKNLLPQPDELPQQSPAIRP